MNASQAVLVAEVRVIVEGLVGRLGVLLVGDLVITGVLDLGLLFFMFMVLFVIILELVCHVGVSDKVFPGGVVPVATMYKYKTIPSYVREAALISARSQASKKECHVSTSSAFSSCTPLAWSSTWLASRDGVKGVGSFMMIFAEQGEQ